MGRVRYTPSHVLKEVVLTTKILRETWFGLDGQSQIHTQWCLEGSLVGEETIGRDQDRMGRVRYTPSRVLEEVVVTKLLCEAWFGSDGQSQIHTQPCLEGSRVGEGTIGRDLDRMGRVRYTYSCVLKEVVLARKPLGETGIGWAESDTHPTIS
jgi:hypothetical protein